MWDCPRAVGTVTTQEFSTPREQGLSRSWTIRKILEKTSAAAASRWASHPREPPKRRWLVGASAPFLFEITSSNRGPRTPARLISISWSLPGGLITKTADVSGYSTSEFSSEPQRSERQ